MECLPHKTEDKSVNPKNPNNSRWERQEFLEKIADQANISHKLLVHQERDAASVNKVQHIQGINEFKLILLHAHNHVCS